MILVILEYLTEIFKVSESIFFNSLKITSEHSKLFVTIFIIQMFSKIPLRMCFTMVQLYENGIPRFTPVCDNSSQ